MRKKLTRFVDQLIVSKIEKRLFNQGVCPPWMKRRPLRNFISLVVPCYNVEKYIDQFLATVVSQTSTLENLEVILVDDGSTDDTGAIAKRWQERFPNVIKYHYQSNQGLCGARNTGLRLATGDWVSFPDPDDFLHHRYIENIDKVITSNKAGDLSLVCCNFIRYFEASGRKRDDHALNFRFKGGRKWFSARNLKNHMQLAVNSVFMRRSEMIRLKLTFDPLIVPGFEDANVVNRYLLNLPKTYAVFLPEAKYYYRKRADESSLQDTAKTKKEFYLNQNRYGWLPVLKEAADLYGSVPQHVQRTILYDTIGHFRTHLKRPQSLDLLDDEEKALYREIMRETFRYIDRKLVSYTSLPGLYEDLRVGILNLYYAANREVTTVYVTHYDRVKSLVRFSYFSAAAENNALITIDGEPAEHLYPKSIRNKFADQDFFYEHAFWVPLRPGALSVTIGDAPARFKLNGKNYEYGISARLISSTLSPAQQKRKRSAVKLLPKVSYESSWLIMDRCDKADDNGEHFYRYLLRTQSHVNAYFVLQKNSVDWPRLKAEGFRLIEYGSARHRAALLEADFLISSHADRYIRIPFPNQKGAKYRFVFIQHGVTKDDQSEWFNNIMPALLATATPREFDSIVDERSNYYLSHKETVLTGFPRHDALLQTEQKRKTVFIMPTWREHLAAKVIAPGVRSLRPNFANSDYVVNWSELLRSDQLKSMCERLALDIVFCPHPNLAAHLGEFNPPDHVKLVLADKVPSLQPFFRDMAVMVTDYSSVGFEAGFLDKPLVYFQFDRDTFFRGHIYRRGYFDYERDGFGPVVTELGALMSAIEAALTGNEDPIYRARRVATFPLRDGKASERLYHAISSLNEPAIAEIETAVGRADLKKAG